MPESAASPSASPSTRCSSVLRGLVEWARERPAWQQDALRRIWQQGELTAGDLDELEALSKARHGALSANETAPALQPLDASHIPASGSVGNTVSLCGISNVRHVNALEPEQTLRFHPTGLTIVYGRNASGKSGYVRILKKACRARASADPILPNAYADFPTEPASATIEFELAGRRETVAWSEGQAVDEALSTVSVFDAACASVHVEKTNDVAYTPAALNVLRQLGDACLAIKKRLQEKADALRTLKPASLVDPKCRDHTRVGAQIRSLSGSTDFEGVKALATLDEAERKRLEQLKADLARDPAKAAQELTARKTRLTKAINQVQTLESLLSDQALVEYGLLVDDALARAAEARVAATELFQKEPLLHVGSETWRALWDAARQYSEIEAYPGRAFPHVGEDARCVLCQQELSPEAVSRLTRFEDFVKANTQKAAADVAQKVANRREVIESLPLQPAACRNVLTLVRDELGEQAAASRLLAFLMRARWRKRLALEAKDGSGLRANLPSLSDSVASGLARVQSNLEVRIKELQEAARCSDRRSQEMQLQELEDKVWLADMLEDVRNEITRLTRLGAINKCISDTDTHGISQKSNDVARILVTKALHERFSTELRDLGMGHLQVGMVADGSRYGVPQFKIALTTITQAKTSDILSEGEHRCVALAAFLSELATANSQSGIVFDDPVCSLDHGYREAFASRLVEESKRHQVIVFTHDMWFVFQLARAARKNHASAYYQYVSSNNTMIGLCESDLPFKCRPLDEAIASMEKHAANMRDAYEAGQMVKWQDTASGLFGRVRETWELAVEEVVSPVLRRFAEGVDTKGLHLLTVLTEADCAVVDEAREKCSRLQHSASAATNEPPSTPDDLDKEITALKKWLEDVRARQQKIK